MTEHPSIRSRTGNVVFVGFGGRASRRVQVSRMRYRSEPASLTIERILAQEPYARVVISREQILNISAVFDPEGAAAQRAAFLAAYEPVVHGQGFS